MLDRPDHVTPVNQDALLGLPVVVDDLRVLVDVDAVHQLRVPGGQPEDDEEVLQLVHGVALAEVGEGGGRVDHAQVDAERPEGVLAAQPFLLGVDVGLDPGVHHDRGVAHRHQEEGELRALGHHPRVVVLLAERPGALGRLLHLLIARALGDFVLGATRPHPAERGPAVGVVGLDVLLTAATLPKVGGGRPPILGQAPIVLFLALLGFVLEVFRASHANRRKYRGRPSRRVGFSLRVKWTSAWWRAIHIAITMSV